MKRVLICLGFVLLAGCAAEEPGTAPLEASHTMTFTTRVTSEPPGARIELDDEIIGETPLEIEWEVYSADQNLLFKEDHVVRALPTGLGRYTKKRTFSKGTAAPKTIFFDMKK
jgi:hypothetical protein